MKKWISILFFITVSTVLSFSQSTVIKGSISGFEDSQNIYLNRFNGSKIETIDSSVTDAKGNFIFNNIKYPKHGLYQIQIGSTVASFPIPKNSSKIEIITSKKNLETGIVQLKNSNEVEAYQDLISLYDAFKEKKFALNQQIKSLFLYDKKYQAKYDSLHLLYIEQLKKLNTDLSALQAKYPGTYTDLVLAPIFKVPSKKFSLQTDSLFDTEEAYLHYHFFDKLAFHEDGTQYNPYIEDKILEYLKNYIVRSPIGIRDGMEIIIKKAAVNINMKEFVVSYLLGLLAQGGDIEIAEYIFKNYYSEGCEGNIQPHAAQMIENIKRLSAGNLAPDIELINLDSKRESLYKIANKKVILLYFWSSTCSHCREATPKMKKLYENYKDKGLEVFAISLDQNYAEWNAFVKANELNWINVSELKGWDTHAAQVYAISGTPTFFLLDENFKIIGRSPTLENAQTMIRERLD